MPDMTNVVKVHVRSSANRTDMIDLSCSAWNRI